MTYKAQTITHQTPPHELIRADIWEQVPDECAACPSLLGALQTPIDTFLQRDASLLTDKVHAVTAPQKAAVLLARRQELYTVRTTVEAIVAAALPHMQACVEAKQQVSQTALPERCWRMHALSNALAEYVQPPQV